MASVRPSRSLVFVALGVVACSTLGFAEEEPPARAARVEAVAYDVFHGDSIHRMGYYVREIHVPSRGFAFYVANGELRVFRPEQGRYALPGETLKLAIPGGESIELPVSHVPGTEPKRVGPLRLPSVHADELEDLLRTKTRLRAVADTYLLPSTRFVPVAVDRTRIPPTPAGVDVVAHVSRFPGSDTVEEGGKHRIPKYGDLDVEQAETLLEGRHPRPWTVERLKVWYAETAASEQEARGALLYLLAASRDPDSVVLLGKALSDEQLMVRVAATYAILKYWCEEPMVSGGTESAMEQAQEWWESRRSTER